MFRVENLFSKRSLERPGQGFFLDTLSDTTGKNVLSRRSRDERRCEIPQGIAAWVSTGIFALFILNESYAVKKYYHTSMDPDIEEARPAAAFWRFRQ